MVPRDRQPHERLTFRPAEAAQILGVHSRTIYKWMDSGQVPSVVIGRVRLIRASDLRAMVGERDAIPGSEGSSAGVVRRTAIEHAAYVVMFGKLWRCVLRGERVECAILPSDQGDA